MISVIIPVYNVEDYLVECLESLKNQTYGDFEVVMVNDGSTDSSKEICDRYTSDTRFKLIDIPNSGVSHARNVGLANATGDFVSFLDSDDVYDPNFLKLMAEIREKSNSDIVACTTQQFIEKYEVCDYDSNYEIVGKKELYRGIFITNKIGGFVCNKLFKKEIIEGVYFDEKLSICEDMIFTMEAIKKSNKIAKTELSLYKYRNRSNSATRNLEKTFENGASKYFIAYDKLFNKQLIDEEFIGIARASICLICIGQKCDYKNLSKNINKENIKNLNKVINNNIWCFIKCKEIRLKKKIVTILNHLFNLRRLKK